MIARFTGVLVFIGGVAYGVATGNALLCVVSVVAGFGIYAFGGRA